MPTQVAVSLSHTHTSPLQLQLSQWALQTTSLLFELNTNCPHEATVQQIVIEASFVNANAHKPSVTPLYHNAVQTQVSILN